MQLLEQARYYLAAINPALPAVALVLVLWAPQAAIRRWLPALWAVPAGWGPKGQELRRVWQALPSLAGGALLGALSSGGDPWAGAWGAVVAAAAPFWHHLLKAAPIPYQGELGGKQNKGDDDKTPPGGSPIHVHFLAAPCFLLAGCGLFGSDTPDAEKACPAAAKVAAVDCPALAVSKCEGKPWDECPARADIEAECDRMIDKAMEGCK